MIGLTCRLDVTELLEKRVKSRFSHRQIFLFYDNNFDARMALLQDSLSIPEDTDELDETFIQHWNKQIKSLCLDKKMKDIMNKFFSLDNSERTFKSFLVRKFVLLVFLCMCTLNI